MSSYCLLRSSGQGPEGWEPLVQQLERRGHRALTPAFHVSRTALKTGRSVPEWQRTVAREWLGVKSIELPGGHCPNVGRPEELADVLEHVA